MFTDVRIAPVGSLVTGGATETRQGRVCLVPELNLISQLQALLHEGGLKILRSLPEAEALVRELQDFRAQYTDAGHMTFNARSGRHDARARHRRMVRPPRRRELHGYGSSGRPVSAAP